MGIEKLILSDNQKAILDAGFAASFGSRRWALPSPYASIT